MILRITCFAIILSGLIASTNLWADDTGDICVAKARTTHSIGMRVSFQGEILSDGMHSTLVVPDQCKSEGYAISAGGSDDGLVSIMRQAIMIGAPGTTDKKIVIDIDAVVILLPNGNIGIRVTKLNRMILTYPAKSNNGT